MTTGWHVVLGREPCGIPYINIVYKWLAGISSHNISWLLKSQLHLSFRLQKPLDSIWWLKACILPSPVAKASSFLSLISKLLVPCNNSLPLHTQLYKSWNGWETICQVIMKHFIYLHGNVPDILHICTPYSLTKQCTVSCSSPSLPHFQKLNSWICS